MKCRCGFTVKTTHHLENHVDFYRKVPSEVGRHGFEVPEPQKR